MHDVLMVLFFSSQL